MDVRRDELMNERKDEYLSDEFMLVCFDVKSCDFPKELLPWRCADGLEELWKRWAIKIIIFENK